MQPDLLLRYRTLRAAHEKMLARVAVELDALSAKIEGDRPAPISEYKLFQWDLMNAELLRLSAEIAVVLRSGADRID